MPMPGRPRNPLGETPTRWHATRHVIVPRLGETPGDQTLEKIGGSVLGRGLVRRVWRQRVNFIPAPPPFDVTRSPGIITRALRYKATSFNRQAGFDNHNVRARKLVPARHASRPANRATGYRIGRPTVRNRMSSFGSRVRPLNAPSPAASDTKRG